MKLAILLVLTTIFTNFAHAKRIKKKCSLAYSMKPVCYQKRSKPIFKIALVNYGETMKNKDLNRVSGLLKERFEKANGHMIQLEIIEKKVLPFKHKLPVDYKFKNITDKERLHRIWYYENLNAKIMNEVYYEYRRESTLNVLNKLDAILIITGAQFDGLGFANGRVSITEYPREIAWGLSDGGSTEYPSDYTLVDELIHELGHNMFLGHSSTPCQRPGLSLKQSKKCCKTSPNRNDILSYCRDRKKVNEEVMYGFESCNRSMIKNKVIPAMLNGSRWNIKGRTRCI